MPTKLPPPVVVALGLLLALAVNPTPLAAQERAVKLITVTADREGLTRQFFGRVVARQTVDLAFQVAGQIVEFPAVEGETIKQGDLVARLDVEPFQLSLDQALVEQDRADRAVERFNQLSTATVSRVTVDDAETQAALAAIAVGNAEYALANATLNAPFDALVASRTVANFASIGAGTPAVRLHDMSELRIEIEVPEILFQRAGADPDVEIWAEFPASDDRFPLEIREFNAEASTVGQTFQLTFGLPPPPDLAILPGSSVTVTARLRGGGGVLRVPASAVAAEADGSFYVMAFDPAAADTGKVVKTPVTIEASPDGELGVVEGLNEGQEIVAAGVARLTDGEAVRRFTGFSG